MNLLFNSTEDFESDLRQFEKTIQEQITKQVNRIACAFVRDKQAFSQQARKPYRIELNNGYDSSLYTVKVDQDINVVMTVDNDPLFGQVIVTLMRVVKRAALREAYQGAAQALYRSLNGHFTKQGV